jgi:hypothetical protein
VLKTGHCFHILLILSIVTTIVAMITICHNEMPSWTAGRLACLLDNVHGCQFPWCSRLTH